MRASTTSWRHACRAWPHPTALDSSSSNIHRPRVGRDDRQPRRAAKLVSPYSLWSTRARRLFYAGRQTTSDGSPADKMRRGHMSIHREPQIYCVAPGARANGVPASNLALAGSVESLVLPVGSTHGHW
jgi:hypothetical protein